jgi:hypothetical protein
MIKLLLVPASMKNQTRFFILSLACLGGVSSTPAATLSGDLADAAVDASSVNSAAAASLASGNPGSTNTSNAVFVFQLPSLGAVTDPFLTASLNVTLEGTNSIDGFNGGNHYDLYALGRRPSGSPVVSDFFLGASDSTDATLIQDDFITSANTARFSSDIGKTVSAGSLLSYLNTQYAGGAGAGEYVFLRVNPDFTPGGTFDRITFYSADAATSTFHPSIEYTAAPVPEATSSLLLTLAVLVPASRRSRRNAR